jgi:phage gpG-like protein
MKKMKKIVRLTESDLTRIVKRVLKEQSDDRFDNELPDYRADIYGRGEMFDKNDRIDAEYNEDDWEDWFEVGGNPDQDDYEEYLNSPVGKDPNSRWSSNMPARNSTISDYQSSQSRKWWDQEKRARLNRTGSSALKVKKRRFRE